MYELSLIGAIGAVVDTISEATSTPQGHGHHQLLATIAAGFFAAWVLGLFTQWLKLSPIVGYLLGGVLIGPYTPGFVGDEELATQLSEIGVILLMFGVGLHFHLKDLLAVKAIAIPGAIGQSLAATVAAVVIFTLLGFSLSMATMLGLSMAVASTVVLMRVLIDAQALHTPAGHAAVGWLLVEDILTVIILVLIPVLGGGGGTGYQLSLFQHPVAALLLAMGKLVVLVVTMFVLGNRIVPWVLTQVARLRSRELFTLTVLVFSVAIAVGAYFLFDASMALGAFLAGMMVAQSPLSHQAAADALPLRDAFAVLFFVSVGMLFDPMFVFQHPLLMVAALVVVLIIKPLAALAIVALIGHSSKTALTVALGLAQIGEFSFILAQLAADNGLMDDSGRSLLVGAAIISITINPLLFSRLEQIEQWLKERPKLWSLLNARAERRASELNDPVDIHGLTSSGGDAAKPENIAIIVGYGPVGKSVDRLLQDAGIKTVIVDLNMDTITGLHSRDRAAIFGDASRHVILEMAGLEHAAYLIVTVPQPQYRAAIVSMARDINPHTRILVRAHYLTEKEELEQLGATAAIFEEAEAAVALTRLVLAETGADKDMIKYASRDIRMRLNLEQVLGRIEKEYPSRHPSSLHEVIITDDRLLNLTTANPDQAIEFMAQNIPAHRLPQGAKVAELAIARERELPTDIGFGVAIPHARCEHLVAPLVVFARSMEGVAFDPYSLEPVHLIFLVITPAEHPNLQINLLSQISKIVRDSEYRRRLYAVSSPLDVNEILNEALGKPPAQIDNKNEEESQD